MTQDSLEPRLLIACAVAREAGALQKRRFLDRDAMVFKFKGPQDYLTATDGEVEKLVRGRLLSAFPGDTFLGEEDGGQVSDCTWVVDPIDGTSNFARGIPYFCVSIAFVLKDLHLSEAEWGSTSNTTVVNRSFRREPGALAPGNGANLRGLQARVSGLFKDRKQALL